MIHLKDLESDKINPKTHKTLLKEYQESLRDRKISLESLEELLILNQERKKDLQALEKLRSKQNKASESIASFKKRGQEVDSLLKEMQNLSSEIKTLKKNLELKQKKTNDILLTLPNVCHPSAPKGFKENENQLIRSFNDNEREKKNFKVKKHWEIGTHLGLMDFKRASKVSGSRFVFLKKDLAKLERILIQFMLDFHIEKFGYEEIYPPFLVNSQSLFHSGHFPKFKEDVFSIENSDLHLVPTGEVPTANYFAGEILEAKDLPKGFVVYTSCFRSEAGSYGKDTKGLTRQHQFNKVELFYFSKPEASFEILEKMTSHAEEILKSLELPYRVMNLCRGELGFAATKCYDIEVWLPGEKAYREISSCSNCLDFQARRANIRFRPSKNEKPQFVHTLNGSGLAIGRTMIAILENYAQDDGSVLIPKALQKLMGKKKIERLKN